MTGLPKKLYFVKVLPQRRTLSYGSKGGGKYTKFESAHEARNALAKQGIQALVYEAETNWVALPIEHFRLSPSKVWDKGQVVFVTYCNCGEEASECVDLADNESSNPILPFGVDTDAGV